MLDLSAARVWGLFPLNKYFYISWLPYLIASSSWEKNKPQVYFLVYGDELLHYSLAQVYVDVLA